VRNPRKSKSKDPDALAEDLAHLTLSERSSQE